MYREHMRELEITGRRNLNKVQIDEFLTWFYKKVKNTFNLSR